MKYSTSDLQLNLKWYGRTLDHDNVRYFDFSASGFEFCFTGTCAKATILSDSKNWNAENKAVLGIYAKVINPEDYIQTSYWNFLEDEPIKKITLEDYEQEYELFSSEKIQTVVIKVIKLSEVNFGTAGLKSLEIEGTFVQAKSEENPSAKIEFIGDSITCGYGIEGVFEKDSFTTQQERADKSYAFLTAKKLKTAFNCVSWSGIGIISNYVDETVNIPNNAVLMPMIWPYTDKTLSLRLGIEPEVWDSSKFSPDIIVINLGTNDSSFVRQVEERRLAFVSGYRQLLEAVHRRSPNAKICCCLGVMGQLLCDSIEEAISLFSNEFKNTEIKFVKFPVQDDNDGIAADWHPSATTHQKMAVQLSEELKNWI